MLSAVGGALRLPVGTLLRRVPGITWAIALAAIFLAACVFGLGASIQRGRLEDEIAHLDSTARAEMGRGVILRRDAAAEHARAESDRLRADTAEQRAAEARVTVQTLVARAGASRASIDETSLAPNVLAALHDADALRIAITPALVSDSTAIALKDGTIARLEATIVLKDLALDADSLAVRALTREVASLTRARNPKCGRTCGAILGGLGVEFVHQLPAIVRALLPRV